jgi:ATP-dependent Clp protease ATP-binding subunit ClpB
MAEQEITTLTLQRYSPEAKALIVATQALADASRHAEVTPLHLLSQCLTGELAVQEVFRRAASNFTDLQAAVEAALARQPVARERATLSALLLDLMKRAEREALRAPEGSLHVEHLLNALAQEVRGVAGELLGAFQIGPGSLRPHLSSLRSAAEAPLRPENGKHPVLALYTTSYVARARAGQFGPVLGRDPELRRLLTILDRRDKHHPLLVGENGVGKATIIRGLAQRLVRLDVPTSAASMDLLELDVGALVAGTRLRGELEARARKLTDALAEQAGAVLVVIGIDQLYATSSALGGLGDLLRSAIDRGSFRLIGTTTPEGEQRIIERDSLLYQRLTRQPVLEPSRAVAAEMVRGAASAYERHHGVEISEDAIQTAVNLAKRYVPDRFLPDSAFDLLDEAAAAKRVDAERTPELDVPLRRYEAISAQLEALGGAEDDATRRARKALASEAAELEPNVAQLRKSLDSRRSARALMLALRSELAEQRATRQSALQRGELARAGQAEHVSIPELESRLARAEAAGKQLGIEPGPPTLVSVDIAQTLALRTGVPVAKMLEAETEKLSQMEARLRRSRVGLRDARRPIGSFLFLGPSGVGKTELAKALAEFLFDDEHALTRLDMSEYMERHMAQRLLGAPPGYADSEQGGLLTEAVRQRPYSVLLFDEVEKAHQDGRLTDGRGRLADFTNTVVILTSNIGSKLLLESGERGSDGDSGVEELPPALRQELGQFFRPEFLNRIGDVVLFGSLSREHLRLIVDIQLDKVRQLLAARGLTLEVSEAAKLRLVELGYEPGFGARPLERTIIRRVQDPIAEGLMAGTFQSGQALELVFIEQQDLLLRAKGDG